MPWKALSVCPGGLLIAMLLPGCATIVSGRTQTIQVRSDPSDVRVTTQPGGHQITTPATLTLARLESGYRLRFEKPGYEPFDVRLKTSTNGWVWGNILIGGLLGVAIDYGTGAAYTLSPNEVEARLTPLHASLGGSTDNHVLIFDQSGALLLTLHLE